MRRRSSLFWRAVRVLEAGLVAASLVLLVFVIVLAIETWRTPWRDPKHGVSIGDSGAAYGKVQDQGVFAADVRVVWDLETPSASRTWEGNIGSAYLSTNCSSGYVYVCVVMPFWLAGVLGGVGPVYIVVRLLTRRRPRACDCQACGYDLTGNTTGVCPECGTPVAQSAGGARDRR